MINKNIYKDSNMFNAMPRKYNIVVEKGQDGYLISDVIELPGCRTQAKTYDELILRTKEAISLFIEVEGNSKPRTKFVSVQQIEV